MDASTIQSRPNAPITTPSPQQAKSLERNEPAVETRPDSDQDDSQKVSNGGLTLSDTSLKLSASSPVKSSDKSAPIENKDQAQQAVRQLLADLQSNPSQAQGAQSNVFAGAVQSLLG